MPLARVGGVDLHYEVSGRRAGDPAGAPSVLFLHGLGSSSADWAFQVPVFAERFRTITLDLPGHGRSSRPQGGLIVEAMAARVAEALERLGEGPAHVVGLSLGGCVALALALGAPDRVRSLTLVNAFARYRPAGLRGALRTLRRLGLLLCAPMDRVAAHVAAGLFPRPEQRDLYVAAVASLSRTPRRCYLAAMGALAAFDARRGLGGIACPTLVVAGDRDATVPLAAKEALARAIAGALLLVVADSGHATPADQPAVFNRAVLDFITAR